jgi:hypothetical protein
MKVIVLPARIQWVRAALLGSVVLAGIEAIVVTRAPWWRLPWPTIAASMGIALAAVLPSAWAVANGRQWAVRAIEATGVVWVVLSTWGAIRFSSLAIALFAVVLAAFWTLMRSWAASELGRSFFDPRLRWYQGLPRPVPGLSCWWGAGASRQELRVSRLDEDGAFVFTPRPVPPEARPGEAIDLEFTFRDRSLRCRGVPVAALGEAGWGLQFAGISPDGRKQLGDFVEILRGEGHV